MDHYILYDHFMPISNPYRSQLKPGEQAKTILCRIHPTDYYYLKRLFPFPIGIMDKVLSTLYKKFIDELKLAGLDPNNPDHTAWADNTESVELVESILSEFRRCSTGRPVGQERPGNDGRGVLRTGIPHGDDEVVGTDSQSPASVRGQD